MKRRRRRMATLGVALLLICLSVSLGMWVTERGGEVGTVGWSPLYESREKGALLPLKTIEVLAQSPTFMCPTGDDGQCETWDLKCECPPPCETQDCETQGCATQDCATQDCRTVDCERDVRCPPCPEPVLVACCGLEVKEVVLRSEIEPLAVLGQLTLCGVPIPDSIFVLYVGLAHPSCSNWACVTSVRFVDEECCGIEADGAQIAYIIPGNGLVTFSISLDQFVIGKEYWLPHLPNDPPGAASIAFF